MQQRINLFFPENHLFFLIFAFFFLLISPNSYAAQSNFQKTENQSANSQIIASFYQNNGEKKLIAGFKIKIDKNWQIYGPDSSGYGVPPSFDFGGSENIDSKNLQAIFPKSKEKTEQIFDETIKYSVYENEVIIPIKLPIKDETQDAQIELEVNYGLCKDVCVPVNQKFSLNIPSAEIDKNTLLEIQKYLKSEKIIDQKFSPNNLSLFRILLIAFIGGLILNIMPCVLPVLSIKLLSIINHRDAEISRIRFAFLSTITGIIFTFTIFAIFTAFLKILGNSVGWGLQFQNPYFLIFLLIILIIFIANLLGIFEINFSNKISSKINQKIDKYDKNHEPKNIFLTNFFSGILAVLLATPCSAPFVGVAISFALSTKIFNIFIIFLTMSLGLSLPYIILVAFPQMVRKLPKPGKWMIKIKNLMAGFLMATTIWLIFILCDIIGFISAMIAAILILFYLPFLKLIKKIHLEKFNNQSRKLLIWAILIIFAFLSSIIFLLPMHVSKQNQISKIKDDALWSEFDEDKIPILVKEGKVVVVDITASWCITCQANKALVLNSDVVQNTLSQKNIIAMRGDLTTPNQEITNFMKKYNRFGIPFNIVFGPSAPNGALTSELLSKEALIAAINNAK